MKIEGVLNNIKSIYLYDLYNMSFYDNKLPLNMYKEKFKTLNELIEFLSYKYSNSKYSVNNITFYSSKPNNGGNMDIIIKDNIETVASIHYKVIIDKKDLDGYVISINDYIKHYMKVCNRNGTIDKLLNI